MARPKKVKDVKSDDLYAATVRVLGKTVGAVGKTPYEAIEKLNPGNVAGMAILSVSRGANTKEHILPHMISKRLFNTMGTTREVALKNASLIFDNL